MIGEPARVGLILVLACACAGCPPKTDASGKPITLGRIRLRTFPAGAKVWIDGELKVEETPATLVLEEGIYALKIQLEGAAPMHTDLEIDAGDNREVEYKPPRPRDATITVLSDVEGAKVRINGYTRGYTPLLKAVTRPGSIDMTVLGPAGMAKSVKDELEIGEQKVLEVFFGDVASIDDTPELPLAPMSEPPPQGTITIGAKPDGEVFTEDDRSLGKTPITNVPMDPGEHRLYLRSLDGQYEKAILIEVEPKKSAVFRFRFEAKDTRPGFQRDGGP